LTSGEPIVQVLRGIGFAGSLAVLLGAAPALAHCDRQGDQAVRASGEVTDAWVDRRGVALYLLDSGDLACATEGYQTYVLDPIGNLRCRAGQQMTVVGRFEPVWFDFTGSGYFIRAESLTCV
jgi:hypothetical protein